MGLTVHYGLQSGADEKGAAEIVRQIRERALDLPFKEVNDIVDLHGEKCDFEKYEQDNELRWLLIQAQRYVKCPWNKHISQGVAPTRLIAFSAWPGEGCEESNFGLVQYPAEIDWAYKPEDDTQFQIPGTFGGRFSYEKWERKNPRRSPWECKETRKVPLKLNGWSWHSFCKTQYASNADCGGVANFLHCHITLITLLDRIKKIPGVKVSVSDEGHYGAHTFAYDYDEAVAAGREPKYRRHGGKYDPRALAAEVGEWNEMIAGFAGAFSDLVAGGEMSLAAPIKSFPDFEKLEFKGYNRKHLEPFLKCMASLAEHERAKAIA